MIPSNSAAQSQPPVLLRRRFACRASLRRTRISYLRHGGLYLTCDAHYPLRTRLCLVLGVTGEESELCLNATVAMTGPLPGVWTGRQGIAVAFDDDDAGRSVDALLNPGTISQKTRLSTITQPDHRRSTSIEQPPGSR